MVGATAIRTTRRIAAGARRSWWSGSAPAACTRVLIDTSPDLREQLLDANADALDGVFYTHEHADHVHGIDDLRGYFLKQRRLIDVYLAAETAKTVRAQFDYCFKSPPGSDYPPIVRENRFAAGQPVTVEGKGGPISGRPVLQAHGDTPSFGFRFGRVMY